MAKKSATFKWQGYCNINITEHLVDDAQQYMTDDKTVWFEFNQALTSDYRISLNYDGDQENFKATMTCYAPDDENFGYAMSAYGGDFYTAIAAVLFKHFHVADKSWQEYKSATKRSFG